MPAAASLRCGRLQFEKTRTAWFHWKNTFFLFRVIGPAFVVCRPCWNMKMMSFRPDGEGVWAAGSEKDHVRRFIFLPNVRQPKNNQTNDAAVVGKGRRKNKCVGSKGTTALDWEKNGRILAKEGENTVCPTCKFLNPRRRRFERVLSINRLQRGKKRRKQKMAQILSSIAWPPDNARFWVMTRAFWR